MVLVSLIPMTLIKGISNVVAITKNITDPFTFLGTDVDSGIT